MEVTAEPLIMTCSFKMVMTTPEAIITGKKNTARASVRPRNFCLSSTAINILKQTISSVSGIIMTMDSVRYCRKKVSCVKKYEKFSAPTNSVSKPFGVTLILLKE